MEYIKQFLLLGNMNAIGYKEIFPLIKDNQLWLGVNGVKSFRQADNSIKMFGNICWYTNIEHKHRNEELDLIESYSAEKYPKYDNYDAIEVSKVADIPMDYDGVMGVPITFLDKYCPIQFEIVGHLNVRCYMDDTGWHGSNGIHMTILNGKDLYSRILIKRK